MYIYPDRIAHTMVFVYTRCGVLAGMINTKCSSIGPPCEIDPTSYCTIFGCSTMELSSANECLNPRINV